MLRASLHFAGELILSSFTSLCDVVSSLIAHAINPSIDISCKLKKSDESIRAAISSIENVAFCLKLPNSN
jgi:hypothetical protein